MSSNYNDYFNFKGSHIVANIKYEVYQPWGYPLILKNHLGRVLATLQVFFDDAPINNQNYPIPIPFEDGFQIIFPSDDSIKRGRPISYVITQHCKEAGFIKFDLGFNKIPSCITDPPENINEVNELRCFDPMAIKANQLDNWKELIIKGKPKTKLNPSDPTGFVSLKEESKAESCEKVGTYLYMTVCPQQTKALSELFENTQWYVEDTIIVEKDYYIQNDWTDEDISTSRSFTPLASPILSRGITSSGITSSGSRSHELTSYGSIAYSSAQATVSKPVICANYIDRSSYIEQATTIINKNIMSSTVAEMTGGQRIICQSGSATHAEYNYMVRTTPRKIGLSIMDIKIAEPIAEPIAKDYSNFNPEEIQIMVMSYLEEIKNSHSNKMLSIVKTCKTYKTDICTVCLENPSNILFVRCGHICACLGCVKELKICPICRANILYKINESVLGF
jgi:hypothetical protein